GQLGRAAAACSVVAGADAGHGVADAGQRPGLRDSIRATGARRAWEPEMTENDTRSWQWLALLIAIGALVWLLAPMLTPFVISLLLAWMGDPLVARLERSGRSRSVAVILVFTLMGLILILAVVVLLPLLEDQFSQLIDWLPNLASWITMTAVPWIENRFHVQIRHYIDPQEIVALLKSHWQQAG